MAKPDGAFEPAQRELEKKRRKQEKEDRKSAARHEPLSVQPPKWQVLT